MFETHLPRMRNLSQKGAIRVSNYKKGQLKRTLQRSLFSPDGSNRLGNRFYAIIRVMILGSKSSPIITRPT